MYLIKGSYSNEIIINKSRFITQIFRVNSLDEINEILVKIRKEHYQANHNCFAYILNLQQEFKKASDDGEPSKTAGYPMLEVLEKNSLENVLAVTTRYFGGIKLGAGGLIRAYTKSVSEIIPLLTLYEKKLLDVYLITLSYSEYNSLISRTDELNINIENTSFTDHVEMKFSTDKENFNQLLPKVRDLFNKQIHFQYIKTISTEVEKK